MILKIEDDLIKAINVIKKKKKKEEDKLKTTEKPIADWPKLIKKVKKIRSKIKRLSLTCEVLQKNLTLVKDLKNNLLSEEHGFVRYLKLDNLCFRLSVDSKYIEIGISESSKPDEDYVHSEYYPIDKYEYAIQAYIERFLNVGCRFYKSSTSNMFTKEELTKTIQE